MARIFAYGSSTTYGYLAREGWADKLKQTMNHRQATQLKPNADVINFGANGRSLDSIAASIDHDVDHFANGRTIGVFMLGLIESRLPSGSKETDMPLQQFVKRLRSLTAAAKQKGIVEVYLGLPPVDETLTKPYRFTGDMFCNDIRLIYDTALQEHASENGCAYIEIWSKFGAEEGQHAQHMVQGEGLHLNDGGHAIVHDAVLPVVLDVLSETTPSRTPRVVIPIQQSAEIMPISAA